MAIETNKKQTFEIGPQSFTLNCICKNVDPVVNQPARIVAKAPCCTKVINLPGEVHPQIIRAFNELGLKAKCVTCLQQATR
jgi:hypothetical protein